MRVYFNNIEVPKYIKAVNFLEELGYKETPTPFSDYYNNAMSIIRNWDSTETSLSEKFSNNKLLAFMPMIDTSNVTNMDRCFYGCSNLITVSELDTSNVTTINSCFEECPKLKRISSISFKSMGRISSAWDFIFGYSYNVPCRYLLIKDIGTNSACTTLDCTYARVCGIADTEIPDARQSLIDSLLTYSFDRRAAGYNDCAIKLYSNVKALLTEDEIAQIQAKGYLLTTN